MQIHHYHQETGEYVGSSEADRDPLEPVRFLIPASATTDAPPAPGAGQFAAREGGAWVIKTRPAPAPEPTPPSAAQIRAGQIRARLAAIDAESIRAMRASVTARNGNKPVPQADAGKLDTLETEAAALRAELAGLPA